MAFARTVHAALFSMKQLSFYKIHIGNYDSSRYGSNHSIFENKFARPFLPVNAPFKLHSFYCSGLALNALLVRFLRNQKSILEFEAPGIATNYMLRAPVLPNLQSLTGPDSLLRHIVPGRPVASVRCTNPAADHAFLALVERLKNSTIPLKHFVVPSIRLTGARDLLPIVADNIPSLESLVMSDHTPSLGLRTQSMVNGEHLNYHTFIPLC